MKTWFTSDTHFGHANIIKYDKRPFDSVEHMNETLIHNINEKVGEQDILYHLGDFAFGPSKPEKYIEIIGKLRNQIKCRTIRLVAGNHDNHIFSMRNEYLKYFTTVDFLLEEKIEHQRIVMCHYAMLVWNRCHHGVYHLYAHSHGSLPDNPNSKSFDVGVNCHNYYPISMERVHEIMAKKKFVPIDHHNKDTKP